MDEYDESDMCSICLQSNDQDSIILQNCVHKFHQECLKSWIVEAPIEENCFDCPLCRAKTPVNQIIPISAIHQIMYPMSFGIFLGFTANLFLRCNPSIKMLDILTGYLFPGSSILQTSALIGTLSSTQTKPQNFVPFLIVNQICAPLIIQPSITLISSIYLIKEGDGYISTKSVSNREMLMWLSVGTLFGSIAGTKLSKFIHYLSDSIISYF